MYPASVLPFEAFEIAIGDVSIFSTGLIAFGYQVIEKDHIHFGIIIEMGSGLFFIFDVKPVLGLLTCGILLKDNIRTSEGGLALVIKGQHLHPFFIAAEAVVVKAKKGIIFFPIVILEHHLVVDR